MKNLMMFLGAVLLCASAACSSSSDGSAAIASGNCPSVGGASKCSADAPATQSDVDACNKDLSDATCGAKYKAALECEGQNQTCGSDNKTDGTALLAACSSQLSDYSACTQGEAGDGGT